MLKIFHLKIYYMKISNMKNQSTVVFKPDVRHAAWFLEIAFVREVCVSLCVCPPPRLLINIHVK